MTASHCVTRDHFSSSWRLFFEPIQEFDFMGNTCTTLSSLAISLGRPTYRQSRKYNAFEKCSKISDIDNSSCQQSIAIIPIDKLSPDVESLLDSNCKERIGLFQEYEEGWDLGIGKRLSPMSFAGFELFLRCFHSFHTEPSIFMTHDGYLQLSWEDSSGLPIEIEFTPDGLDCYIESLPYEETIQLNSDEIESLVEKIKNI